MPKQRVSIEDVNQVSEGLEWSLLWSAGLYTNLTLYVVAAIAYMRPVAIGATLLLVAALLIVLSAIAWPVGLYVATRVRIAELLASGEVEWKPGAKSSVLGRLLRGRGQ